MDYAKVVSEYGLREVSPSVVRRVMKRIHDYMAECSGMATDDDYLLIRGGNLAYYAGLEYETPELSGKGWTLYRGGERIDDLIAEIQMFEADEESPHKSEQQTA